MTRQREPGDFGGISVGGRKVGERLILTQISIFLSRLAGAQSEPRMVALFKGRAIEIDPILRRGFIFANCFVYFCECSECFIQAKLALGVLKGL